MGYVEVCIERRVFFSNNPVPGVTSPQCQFYPEEQTLNLPEIQIIGDPNNSHLLYQRQFWTYKGTSFVYTPPPQGASIPGAEVIPPPFTATCWYTVSSIDNGTYPIGMYTSAFLISKNQFVTDCAIESVSPAGIWNSPNTYVPSDQANVDVFVTAKPLVDNEFFRHWFVLGKGVFTDRVFKLGKGEIVWAVAIYGPRELFLPPNIRQILEGILTKWPFPIHPEVDPVSLDMVKIMWAVITGGEVVRGSMGEPREIELEAMARKPLAADALKLKQGLADIKAKIGRLDILRRNIEDALGKIK